MAPEKRLRKLPVQQLTILAICRFAEPISLTSIFPYLPEMIESFQIPESDIAFWAGTTSAIYSLSQCLTAIAWGRASDRFGRKYIILLGLVNTLITSLLWGFSTTLPMALAARALSGAGNGNVGIIRTMVAEMCPWRELQPRAFSVMPLVYNIGSVLGPAFGGALSNPLRRKPGEQREGAGGLLWMFPYALPNIVAAAFFLVGIVVGTLFLHETLASKKDKEDWGLVLGVKVKGAVREGLNTGKRLWYGLRGRETEPLLQEPNYSYATVKDEETADAKDVQVEDEKPPSYSEALTKQTVLNLGVYTLLAMHSIAFDQLLPVFMHHPRSGPGVEKNQFPFKFNQGFGIDSGRIGLLFTLYGVVGIFYQFVIFPPLARKYGVLHCLRIVLAVMPIVYLLAPFSTLMPDVVGAEIALFLLWLVKGLCSTFAFPCSTILLTNSAPSLRVLGTINGMATSISAIGRAAGPSIGGSVFTWGVKEGYIIAPFWVLAFISALTTIPTWWLVEGEGFGHDDDDADEADIESIEDSDSEDTPTIYKPLLKPPSGVLRTNSTAYTETGAETETDDAIGPLLSRESTLSRTFSRRMSHRGSLTSNAITESDDADDEDEDPWPTEWNDGAADTNVLGTSLTHTASGRSRRASEARRRVTARRRSSVPIGMGPGFRRMSSNLGQTRSGFGDGGGLAGG